MFTVIRLRGNPIIALPKGTRRVRLACVSRIQGFTIKRALFRHALRLITALGLERIISSAETNPLDGSVSVDFGRIFEAIATGPGPTPHALVLIWPWPPGTYRGRVYVHSIDDVGNPVSFSKISLDETQDCRLLNEARVLNSLTACPWSTARIPKVLALGRRERVSLTLEAVPGNAHPIGSRVPYPESAVAEFAGPLRIVSHEALLHSPWWAGFLQNMHERHRPFALEMTSYVQQYGLRVCRVHGDFSAKNLLTDGEVLWILDWEDANEEAPHLTDWVAFFAASKSRRIVTRTSGVLSELLANGANGSEGQHRMDVGMALAYLHQTGSRDATRVLDQWLARYED